MDDKKVFDLHFDALRNAIYHTARKGFLDRLNRLLSFIIVVAGTTAVGDFGAKIFTNGSIFASMQLYAAIAALAGSAQLVFDFGGAARTHEFLQHQYYELVAKVSETVAPSEDTIAKWKADLHRLYASETMPMRALDSLAYNAALESLAPNNDHRIKVKWFQVLLAQYWAFNDAEFPWMKDGKAKAKS